MSPPKFTEGGTEERGYGLTGRREFQVPWQKTDAGSTLPGGSFGVPAFYIQEISKSGWRGEVGDERTPKHIEN